MGNGSIAWIAPCESSYGVLGYRCLFHALAFFAPFHPGLTRGNAVAKGIKDSQLTGATVRRKYQHLFAIRTSGHAILGDLFS